MMLLCLRHIVLVRNWSFGAASHYHGPSACMAKHSLKLAQPASGKGQRECLENARRKMPDAGIRPVLKRLPIGMLLRIIAALNS